MAGSARKGKGRAVTEDGPVTAAIPLGKQLAHTDKAVRDRAIRSLVAFLSRGSGNGDGGESSTFVKLDELEMQKLWKGLFYCFWMSDKPLIQQGLARDLSELLLQIDPFPSTSSSRPSSASRGKQDERLAASLDFLRGFWEAIVREWEGLDKLRTDKFYMLIRRFVNASFRLLARHDWEEKGIEGLRGILTGANGPLNYSNVRIPISLSTHLADVYLTELDSCLALPDSPPASIVQILQPFFAVLVQTPNPVVYKRLLGTLIIPLLDALRAASPAIDEPPRKRKRTEEVYPHILMKSTLTVGGKVASVQELRRAVLQAIFSEAAKEGVRESNRRKVYQLWREEGGADDDDEDDEE